MSRVKMLDMAPPEPNQPSSQDRPSASRRFAPRPGALRLVRSSGRVMEMSDVLEETIARHPAGSQMSESELLLLNLQKQREVLVQARDGYEQALKAAIEAEIPNSVIARRVRLSEAAIRMFVRRKMRGAR